MNYNKSIFNIKCRDINNNLLIINTYSNKMLRISKENEDEVLKILNNDLKITNKNLVKKMLDTGIIVKSDINEMKIVKDEIEKSIYGYDFMNLTIVPTDACNFNCKYCYQQDQVHYMSDTVIKSLMKFVSVNIYNYKHLSLNWFGGEPLICKDKVINISSEIKNICKKNKVNFIGSITTNGSELDISTFNKLIRNNILFYQITIDGINKTHNKYRRFKNGQESFDTIINNLRDIRDNIKLKVFQIAIRVNLTKEIDKYREDFLKFYKSEFGDDRRFYLYLERVKDWGGVKIENIKNEIINKESDILLKWMNRATELNIQLPRFYEYNKYQSICDGSKKNGFIVNYDGSLNKCTLAIYDEEFKDLNNIGNINNSLDKVNIKKSNLWTGLNKREKDCFNCSVLPFCGMVGCSYEKLKKSEIACRKYEIIELFRLQAINASNFNKCIDI
ncbi:radical SAM/SPASM domain-containing protein [Clostridium sp.]|uniref:radical SAM/SPASM domain-containing protein n=5 Tax=Clostridium TaxID=1485 RepID=UPI0025BBE4D8|nr:radical SAM protein [Clostridium sp.]MCI9303724.1 radical SAM protein [Clostridium sp.]